MIIFIYYIYTIIIYIIFFYLLCLFIIFIHYHFHWNSHNHINYIYIMSLQRCSRLVYRAVSVRTVLMYPLRDWADVCGWRMGARCVTDGRRRRPYCVLRASEPSVVCPASVFFSSPSSPSPYVRQVRSRTAAYFPYCVSRAC